MEAREERRLVKRMVLALMVRVIFLVAAGFRPGDFDAKGTSLAGIVKRYLLAFIHL